MGDAPGLPVGVPLDLTRRPVPALPGRPAARGGAETQVRVVDSGAPRLRWKPSVIRDPGALLAGGGEGRLFLLWLQHSVSALRRRRRGWRRGAIPLPDAWTWAPE